MEVKIKIQRPTAAAAVGAREACRKAEKEVERTGRTEGALRAVACPGVARVSADVRHHQCTALLQARLADATPTQLGTRTDHTRTHQ